MSRTGLSRGIQACTPLAKILQLLFLIALSMAMGKKKKEKILAKPNTPRVQLRDLIALLYKSWMPRR